MGDYLRKPPPHTVERDNRDRDDKKRRQAWRNRRPCQCGSKRLADPISMKCIACDPLTKPAWDAWLSKEGAVP